MTDPDPARPAALYEQAAALRRVAEELDTAVAATSALAGELAASWVDLVGRGWAQRLDLVRRELVVQADAAAELMRAVENLADTAIGSDPGPMSEADEETSGPPWSLPGPRLGGTDGSRVGERRGIVVPSLTDGPDRGGGG